MKIIVATAQALFIKVVQPMHLSQLTILLTRT